MKKYREDNKESLLEKRKKWSQDNKEKISKEQKKYRENHKIERKAIIIKE